MSKERVTIAFFINAFGEKMAKPVLIGKSKNPQCFKGIKKCELPVDYYDQKKAWMTGGIMHEVLIKINKKWVIQFYFL